MEAGDSAAEVFIQGLMYQLFPYLCNYHVIVMFQREYPKLNR